jgi:RNA polymerase sigma factor (sigma-70 family)
LNNHTENNLTDKDLVARVLGGDARVFGLIIKNTEGLVTQILFKMIDHPEDRKDLAQEIYLKAYKKLSGFRFESRLSTWIASIAYHTCINHLERKKPLMLSTFEASPGEEDDRLEILVHKASHHQPYDTASIIHKKEIQAILWSEVARLEPVYRALITLFHQEELSYEEIATVTKMPSGTVKNYLFRARRMLREKLLSKLNTEDV